MNNKHNLEDKCSDNINRTMHLLHRKYNKFSLCPFVGQKKQCRYQKNLIYFRDITKIKTYPKSNGHYPTFYICNKKWSNEINEE